MIYRHQQRSIFEKQCTTTQNSNLEVMAQNDNVYHFPRFFSIQHPSDVCHDFFDTVVVDLRAPASTNSFSPVNQHHGDNWGVPFRLNCQVFVLVVFQQWVVIFLEYLSSYDTATKQIVHQMHRWTKIAFVEFFFMRQRQAKVGKSCAVTWPKTSCPKHCSGGGGVPWCAQVPRCRKCRGEGGSAGWQCSRGTGFLQHDSLWTTAEDLPQCCGQVSRTCCIFAKFGPAPERSLSR